MHAKAAKLILNRVGLGLATLLMVSLVVFAITNLMTGDAAQSGYLSYFSWALGMLAGDFGFSAVQQRPVSELLSGRLSMSLLLAGATALVSVPLGVVLGIVSAIKRDSLLDRRLGLATLSLAAAPVFLMATIAVLLFSVERPWLSAVSLHRTGGPSGIWAAYALAVLTLCCVVAAHMARMTRTALVQELDSAYAQTAVLKGVPPARVVLRDALPNAIGLIANAAALSLSCLLGAMLVVETLFAYPGIASLMVDAVFQRDIGLVRACAMILCTSYVALLLCADVVAKLSRPRSRR